MSATETQVASPTTNQSEPVSSVPNTTYTINSQDLVTKAVDPAGNTRSASYTPFNDVQTSTNGLSGGTTTNTYTSNGGESLNSSAVPDRGDDQARVHQLRHRGRPDGAVPAQLVDRRPGQRHRLHLQRRREPAHG